MTTVTNPHSLPGDDTAPGAHAEAGTSTTVQTDDGARLHVVVDGAAAAPVTVVFAHGWTMSERCWLPIVRQLRSNGVTADPAAIRLVRYDQRGHGRSTGGHRLANVDRLGDDLAQVIAAVSPDRPVVVVGHSMGGMTVMALAARHPELFGDRVVGAVLVGTSAGGLRLKDRRLRQFVDFGARYPLVVGALRRAYPARSRGFQQWFRRGNFGPHATGAMVRSVTDIFDATDTRTVFGFLPAVLAHDKTAELAALQRIPVSIVVGRMDALTPVRHAKRLAELLPDADLHVEPDTGHMVITERPVLLADRIRRLVGTAAGQPSDTQ